MKFRKKPVVIEAMQYDGSVKSISKICQWANDGADEPNIDFVSQNGVTAFDVLVHTLERPMEASPGDWIIKGVKGEFYPCKPDVFEATYTKEPT